MTSCRMPLCTNVGGWDQTLAWVHPEWPPPVFGFWIKFAGGIREDKTELLEIRAPGRIVLKPHVRPFAITKIVLELTPLTGATRSQGRRLGMASHASDPPDRCRRAVAPPEIQKVFGG